MSAAIETPSAPTPQKPRHYGFSVLVTGFVRVWRAPLAMWTAIVGNAVVQALLVWNDPVASLSPAFLLLALVSLLAALAASAVMTAAALETVPGRAGIRQVIARVRRHAGMFTLWFVALLVALLLGSLLYSVPALLIAAATPYLLLAAMDGHTNALAADLRAIGSRPGRWIVTALLMGLVIALSWLIAAVVMFFLTGPPAAFVVWVWFGFLFAWFQSSWASVFRSTEVGHLPLEPAG